MSSRLMLLFLPCVLFGWIAAPSLSASPPAAEQPNILFIIADDMSWPHTGAYGDTVVSTPAFDRLAQEGVLFNFAYSAAASCTISRNAILTGQQPWRLEEGAVFGATLSSKFDVFPLLLEDAGYDVAWAGKSWGPGDLKPGGWGNRHPAGKYIRARGTKPYDPTNFNHFLTQRDNDRPFCFWFGSAHPHRPYRSHSGVKSGKQLDDVTVPGYWPDVPEVRHDILDYYVEVEQFDRQVAHLLETLRKHDAVDNTIVIVTSDHGMPFPRCKADGYDSSNHVPLAIRWPGRLSGGRVVDDFVSLTDIAPTLLEVGGAAIPAEMTGRSLLDLLTSNESGQVDPTRDFVVTSIERHGVSRPNWGTYPIRAIRTQQYMYHQNLEPDRWPNCDPHFTELRPHPERGTRFMNIDPSPTKQYLVDHRDDPAMALFQQACLNKRPGEELYDMQSDPWQLDNLAADPGYAEVKRRLRKRLEDYLRETDDPRMRGEKPFDYYPYRFLQKTPLVPRRPADDDRGEG